MTKPPFNLFRLKLLADIVKYSVMKFWTLICQKFNPKDIEVNRWVFCFQQFEI